MDNIDFSMIQNLLWPNLTTDEVFDFQMKYFGNEILDKVYLEYWEGEDLRTITANRMYNNYGIWRSTMRAPNTIVPIHFRYNCTTIDIMTILSETYTLSIIDNDLPNPRIEGAKSWYKVGEKVTLTGINSVDNVEIVNYTWHFNDGNNDVTIYGPDMEYRFLTEGEQNVYLTVKDSSNNTNTNSDSFQIFEADPPQIFNISYDPEVYFYFSDNISVNFQIYDKNPRRTNIVHYSVRGKLINESAEDLGGGHCRYTFPEPDLTGKIRFWIWSEDQYYNCNRTDEMVILIIKDPDQSMNISYPNSVFHDEISEIMINATTSIPLSSARFWYTDIYGNETSGNLTGNNGNLSFSIPPQGNRGNITFHIRIEYSNGEHLESAEMVIRVLLDNEFPLADAGGNLTVKQGEWFTLSANESYDDGGIVNYTWKIEGLDSHYILHGRWVVFKIPNEGIYEVALIVRDIFGWKDSDTIYITVEKAEIVDVNETWNFTLMIGPVVDFKDTALEGAVIKLIIEGSILSNLTDNLGMAYFNLSSDVFNKAVDITIEKEGYISLEYQTIITHERELETSPGALFPVVRSDRENGQMWIPIITVIILVIMVLIATSIVVIMRRRVSITSDPKESEE
jgi:hypothetical protein